MLSLAEVRRAATVLERRLAGTRLQRAVQTGELQLALEFYGPSGSVIVFLSCRPQFARISVLREMPKAPPAPPAFAQYLRSHLIPAAFEGISASPKDRQLMIRLKSPAGTCNIVLSILGSRSNVYLLDPGDRLAFAMRPLPETRRALALGKPWADPEGAPKSEGFDRWEHCSDASYLEAVEATYASLEMKSEAEVLGRRLASVLNRESEFLDRKAVNILQDLGEARQAEEHRRRGELLKSVLHAIPPGADSVTVPDFETGAGVSIPLDPRLSPAENLTACFRRYQKELRRAKSLEDQLQILRERQKVLAVFRQRLDEALKRQEPDARALQELAGEPVVRKLLARAYPAPRQRPGQLRHAKKEIPSRLRPKRYRTESGLEVWVGRSDEGNDYLTTRLARGNDLFFHLEGYPGSHVILRTEGRSDPPAESILDACELAVHFSKLKDARRADVHVAAVKNIRKPKGAKAGLVYVSGGKTVHLRRDPKRLQNVLAARLDE